MAARPIRVPLLVGARLSRFRFPARPRSARIVFLLSTRSGSVLETIGVFLEDGRADTENMAFGRE